MSAQLRHLVVRDANELLYRRGKTTWVAVCDARGDPNTADHECRRAQGSDHRCSRWTRSQGAFHEPIRGSREDDTRYPDEDTGRRSRITADDSRERKDRPVPEVERVADQANPDARTERKDPSVD